MSKQLSVAEVAAHKDASSGMYIIIDENVYDVTSESSFMAYFLCNPVRAVSRRCPHAGHPIPPNAFNITNGAFRLHRRAPRRLQDPKARSRQGCNEAVLEISQWGCAEEVLSTVEDRDSGGEGEAVIVVAAIVDEREEGKRGARLLTIWRERGMLKQVTRRGDAIIVLLKLCFSTMVRECWCIDIAAVDGPMQEFLLTHRMFRWEETRGGQAKRGDS